MAYEIFARKYRPETFSDLVGQEAIAQTLKNAVASKRVAPVYIFSGSHGVGKTSMARILAKALNCPTAPESDGTPCGKCEVCQSIASGEAIDVVEIDAASNRGIDDARQLRDGVYYRPASFGWKVYILDEFHQLSKEAFDALLKTFEEAPEHVCFILATTELHKVPSTIRSRSQTFLFKRATMEQVQQRLRFIADSESIKVNDQALSLIARRSRGSLRDSQKLFDQVVALSVGVEDITAESIAELMGFAGAGRIAEAVTFAVDGEPAKLLEIVRQLISNGSDPQVFAKDLLEAFRGLLYLKLSGPDTALLDDLMVDVGSLAGLAERLSQEALLYAMQILSEAVDRMRRAREERVLLEMVLVRLAQISEIKPLGELVARLERLEKALKSQGVPSGGFEMPGRSSAAGSLTSPQRHEPNNTGSRRLELPSSNGQNGSSRSFELKPPKPRQNGVSGAAPAAAPLAAPKTPVAAGSAWATDGSDNTGSDLEALQKLTNSWAGLAKGLSVLLEKTLEDGRPLSFLQKQTHAVVVVECREVGQFRKNQLKDADVRRPLEERMSDIVGRPCSIEWRFIESQKKSENQQSKIEKAPIIAIAQKVLHARLLRQR